MPTPYQDNRVPLGAWLRRWQSLHIGAGMLTTIDLFRAVKRHKSGLNAYGQTVIGEF